MSVDDKTIAQAALRLKLSGLRQKLEGVTGPSGNEPHRILPVIWEVIDDVLLLADAGDRIAKEFEREECTEEDAKILEIFTLPEGVTLDTKLEELPGWDDLPTRTKNCLRHENVEDVRSLLTVSRTRKNWRRIQIFGRLALVHGLGRRSRQKLVVWLKDIGFKSKLLQQDSP